MVGLPIRRHRWLASSYYLYAPGPCAHTDGFVNVIGGKVRGYGTMRSKTRTFLEYGKTLRKSEGQYRKDVGQSAMGIDWMTVKEMSESIPPAYTHWIGMQLMDIIEREVA